MTDITPGAGQAGRPERGTAQYLMWVAGKSIAEAHAETYPADRYVRAHNAALEAAASVLASRGIRSWNCEQYAWEALAAVEPALAEQVGLLGATAGRWKAARTGPGHAVPAADADSMLEQAEAFVKAAQLASGIGRDSAEPDPLRRPAARTQPAAAASVTALPGRTSRPARQASGLPSRRATPDLR